MVANRGYCSFLLHHRRDAAARVDTAARRRSMPSQKPVMNAIFRLAIRTVFLS
jgi:hypothetical protein